jgi:hypothetical protein
MGKQVSYTLHNSAIFASVLYPAKPSVPKLSVLWQGHLDFILRFLQNCQYPGKVGRNRLPACSLPAQCPSRRVSLACSGAPGGPRSTYPHSCLMSRATAYACSIASACLSSMRKAGQSLGLACNRNTYISIISSSAREKIY